MVKIKAIIACLLWGTAFVGAKVAFRYADPLFISGLRFTLAGLLLIPICMLKKVDIKANLKYWPFLTLFAFVQTFLQYGLFFLGLHRVPGSISAIIIGAGPLFVAVMAHLCLKDDRFTLRKMAAIFFGISGVVAISFARGKDFTIADSFYLGVALLLLSNIIGSYTNIMVVKRKSNNLSPIFLTAYANFVGGLMLLLISFIVERPELKIYPLEFCVLVVWLAIVPATSFSIWYSLLQRPEVKVSELNVWKFVVPVTGCVLSWLLLPEEVPDVYSISGILLISFSLLLLQMPVPNVIRSPLKKIKIICLNRRK